MAHSHHDETATGQTLISHLIELRQRLLKAVSCVLLVFLALAPIANYLYHYLAEPLLRHLPANGSMIATDVASPFFIPLKLALFSAFLISVPFVLYQVWAFVAPGLYQHEKRLVLPLLIASTLLFYLGAMFAYFVILPIFFGFITTVAPEGVAVMTDIGKYLDFVMLLFFAFGLCFEVPVLTIVAIKTGLVTRQGLAAQRPYVIVAAFVIGMVLTPPDVLSQTLLAVPMWLLFELGLLFSRFFVPEDPSNALVTQDNEKPRKKS